MLQFYIFKYCFLSLRMWSAFFVCLTWGCWRALMSTFQLGSPFCLTWSSLRSHAWMISLRNMLDFILAFSLWLLSPRTSPRLYMWTISRSSRYSVMSTRSSRSEGVGRVQGGSNKLQLYHLLLISVKAIGSGAAGVAWVAPLWTRVGCWVSARPKPTCVEWWQAALLSMNLERQQCYFQLQWFMVSLWGR